MFVPLHTHFDYSILDGGMTVAGGVERMATLGYPAAAITDHGSLGGAYAFHKECLEHGIKPIIGLEAYMAPSSRLLKSPEYWGTQDDRNNDVGGSGKYLHITLLAASSVGLANLYRAHADAFATGFYGKPRVDVDSLRGHNEGIICLTGCAGGALQTALRLGQEDRGKAVLADLKDIFGDRLYIELMDHDIPVERATRSKLLELGAEFGIPFVATPDCHYATLEDADHHDTLLCIQTKAKKSASDRFRFDGSGYHLPTHEDMERLFLEVPGAVSNTVAIAERVEGYGSAFTRHVRLPKFSDNETADLRREAYAGLQRRLGLTAHNQLEFELDVINSAGLPGYFLVEADLLQRFRRAGIRVGPGRGSAAGSLTSYCLGITDVDPLANGLLFERFLNPERISFPDIDVDIDDRRRDEALDIVRSVYGDEFVAQVGTYGEIKSKNALRDAARALGYPYEVGSQLVAKLPPAKFGREPSLAELPANAGPKDVVAAARGVEGLIRSAGIHASAVIISPDNLLSLIPCKYPGGTGTLTTEWDGESLDEIGFCKYDFLGLAALGVIDECVSLLRGRPEIPGQAPQLDLPHTFEDSRTFDLLSNGDTAGVFQLESPGMRSLLRTLRPNTIGDISAVLALYRPGPMGVKAHQEYANRKNGRASIDYPHPDLEATLSTILGETYGLVVYQEQVLKVLSSIGYTYATADLIFNAMRKKDADKMAAAQPDFERRMKENGFNKGATTALWETLVPFADYSFNKAHSTSYAYLSYWTAWLKANYPSEFWCAQLTRLATKAFKKVEHKVIAITEAIRDARASGIEVLPPDINTSNFGWTLVNENIRFGLGSVKGISKSSFGSLTSNRPYTSMDDFWQRVHPKGLNVGVLSAAAKVGAFDSLAAREGLVSNIESLTQRAVNDRALAAKGQRKLWTSYQVGRSDVQPVLRQNWERELLGGVTLTQRAVRMRLTRPLDVAEWRYVATVIANHSGSQPVEIVLGDLTTLTQAGTVQMSPKLELSIRAAGLTIEEV